MLTKDWTEYVYLGQGRLDIVAKLQDILVPTGGHHQTHPYMLTTTKFYRWEVVEGVFVVSSTIGQELEFGQCPLPRQKKNPKATKKLQTTPEHCNKHVYKSTDLTTILPSFHLEHSRKLVFPLKDCFCSRIVCFLCHYNSIFLFLFVFFLGSSSFWSTVP